MTFVAPKRIQMVDHILDDLNRMNASFDVAYDIRETIEDTDVLYMTRIQKERFPDVEEYMKVAGAFRITADMLEPAKKKMIVMHPLPRVDEIHYSVDATPHARYFQQAFNGVPVRMALLHLLLEE